MDTELALFGVFLLVLLGFSGFFSGSETAFFSLNHLEKDKLRKRRRGRLGSFTADILDNPERILVTVLTGNMLVNLLFASFMDRLVARFIDTRAWLFSILIGTLFVLIFGEMTPKNIAIRHPLPFFGIAAGPLFVIDTLLKPFRIVLQKIENGIVSFLARKMGSVKPDVKQVLTSALKVAHRRGIIHVSELAILDSFMEFREKTADEIMVPRIGLEGIESGTRVCEMWDRLSESPDIGLLPVYAKDLDHLVGCLHLRDLLPYRFPSGAEGMAPSTPIRRIMRPIHPVPEKKNVLELFREMRRDGREMAVVLDEYGGTAGIITFQGMIENFLEFFYPTRSSGLEEIAKGCYRLPGLYDLEDLEDLVGRKFGVRSRTAAGLITEHLGEIPVRGTRIELEGIVFIVRGVSGNRVLEIEVRIPE